MGTDSRPPLSDFLRDSDFDEFFHASWRRLYPMALGIAGDRGHAEDALQSALAKAFSHWQRVWNADNPQAYVRRMVLNELIGTTRLGWWRRERGGAPVDIVAPGSTEDTVVVREALWQAVERLPVRQRAVVVLRYYEDLSEAEIADALGCSRGTVKSQASAALATLRRTTGADLDETDLDEGVPS